MSDPSSAAANAAASRGVPLTLRNGQKNLDTLFARLNEHDVLVEGDRAPPKEAKKKRKKKEDGGRSGQDALYNWLTPDHPPLAASTGNNSSSNNNNDNNNNKKKKTTKNNNNNKKKAKKKKKKERFRPKTRSYLDLGSQIHIWIWDQHLVPGGHSSFYLGFGFVKEFRLKMDVLTNIWLSDAFFFMKIETFLIFLFDLGIIWGL
ncbi:MAG: hypothetical protein VX152_12005, partial [Pseudomonadota bacterium]|nr:hypothetical protein [Pseudomonadota bacterium]